MVSSIAGRDHQKQAGAILPAYYIDRLTPSLLCSMYMYEEEVTWQKKCSKEQSHTVILVQLDTSKYKYLKI